MGSVCYHNASVFTTFDSVSVSRLTKQLQYQNHDSCSKIVKPDAAICMNGINQRMLQFDIKVKELHGMVEKHFAVQAHDTRLSKIKTKCFNVAKQLLHIWKDHKCSIIVTSAENGQTTIICDPNRIQHKLCITTSGKQLYFAWKPKNTVWVKQKTIICLKAKPIIKKSLFDKESILFRHMIEITLATFVQYLMLLVYKFHMISYVLLVNIIQSIMINLINMQLMELSTKIKKKLDYFMVISIFVIMKMQFIIRILKIEMVTYVPLCIVHIANKKKYCCYFKIIIIK